MLVPHTPESLKTFFCSKNGSFSWQKVFEGVICGGVSSAFEDEAAAVVVDGVDDEDGTAADSPLGAFLSSRLAGVNSLAFGLSGGVKTLAFGLRVELGFSKNVDC